MANEQNLKPWKTGQSGNPKGRPKGSRNKLGETFLHDLYLDWQKHGLSVIETVRREKPDQYLKIIASILPRDIHLEVNELEHLTDQQLVQRFRSLELEIKPYLEEIFDEEDALLNKVEKKKH